MNAAVVVALIALVGTVANIGLTYALTIRSESRRARLKTDADWDRMLSSLELAAHELRQRLGSILSGDFLEEYGPGSPRKDEAVLSTLFRFAQYFGWSEIARRKLRGADIHGPEARELRDLQSTVGRIFATDRDYGSGPFMVWREAQRAVGELMIIHDGDIIDTLGVAGFLDKVEAVRPWLGRMEDAITAKPPSGWGEADHHRLHDVSEALGELSTELKKRARR
jgi:hypothetical protein